ncbi:gliding motility-associated lipoprotein GldH [Formosa sp. Hel1_31_208]|uniref:gliding motility lipoprotein GldH n=1 Tax=Formosa sp. Hel1_31_208 TaxID=1798225 RepID=UPI00087B0405|nr:gliding motility lipoprotein GldH [Formosa sp. Hel1_31_208]SDR76980.1 gliding motility-associated lipoprotein GldH [Formosa sp. Hel1_31_208]
MQKNKCWIICLLILIVTVSCDTNRVFDEYQSVPDEWDKDNVVAFKVTPPDSINAYNLFVNLRNTEAYKYSNLFLIVELNYPNGKALKDTLEYKMANADGAFLGTGFSDIKENKLWYKGYDKPFVFNEAGEYTINIQHAMRKNGSVDGIDKLEGIIDVGFRIEHSETN